MPNIVEPEIRCLNLFTHEKRSYTCVDFKLIGSQPSKSKTNSETRGRAPVYVASRLLATQISDVPNAQQNSSDNASQMVSASLPAGHPSGSAAGMHPEHSDSFMQAVSSSVHARPSSGALSHGRSMESATLSPSLLISFPSSTSAGHTASIPQSFPSARHSAHADASTDVCRTRVTKRRGTRKNQTRSNREYAALKTIGLGIRDRQCDVACKLQVDRLRHIYIVALTPN